MTPNKKTEVEGNRQGRIHTSHGHVMWSNPPVNDDTIGLGGFSDCFSPAIWKKKQSTSRHDGKYNKRIPKKKIIKKYPKGGGKRGGWALDPGFFFGGGGVN